MGWRDLRSVSCCAQARRLEQGDPRWRFCVCAWLEWCEAHGLTHVGTHD